MLVVLWDMIEKDQTCLMRHSVLKKTTASGIEI